MKINLGSSKLKNAFFPVSFDSSTSSNFGEALPSFCQEVVTDSHVNIDIRSGVRFAPLSLPTFGKAYLHHYAYYHKFVDLWCPYNDFLARTPFTSASGATYVPTQVPNVNLCYLWMLCCAHSSWTVWKVNQSSVINPGSSPLNVGTFTLSPFDVSSKIAILDAGLIMTLASALPLVSVSNLAVTYLKDSSRKSNLIYPLNSSAPSTVINSTDTDNAIYPAGSDFMLRVKSNALFGLSSGIFSPFDSVGTDLLICFKLNNSGKFLRKIFLGLGYQLKNVSRSVSVLPVFAYFKSYFNTFAPKRFMKYDQTYFGRVMTSIVNNGSTFERVLFSDSVNGVSPLSGMLDDLLSCYYTEDTDYYSSQIIGEVNDYGSDVQARYIADLANGQRVTTSIVSDVQSNSTPSLDLGADSDVNGNLLHTQSQQNVLARLTSFVNRRSLVGGKIHDLLQSVFGIKNNDVLDDSNPYIGSAVIDVDFSDVFSTAETAQGSLGEYAGKALGTGESDKLSVDCSAPGLVLVMSCVVPRTQKVQGVNPNLFHVSASQYYNPQFDGLTLLPTDRLSLYCVDSVVGDSNNSASFGNQSIFAEYKTKSQGILNGDLSLLSTKSSYDSFTMDQTIADYIAQEINDDGTVKFVLTSPNLANVAAGTMWRYIGRWLWLGNFDRIFVNTRQTYSTDYPDYSNITWNTRDTHVMDDNLVIHNVVDLKINAPMLPLEDSYMTKDLEDLTSDVGVRSQSE